MSRTSLTIVLVIFGLLACQATALFSDNSKVVKLTTSNFKSLVVDSKELWFIEFYAPWCGHCKNLAPTWEKLASALEGIIKVGAVDMTTDQEAGAPYEVKGFPTVKFFGADKKSPIEYSGDRSLDDLINTAFREAKKAAEIRAKGKASSSSSSKSSSGGSGSGSGSDSTSDKDVVVLTDSNFDELVLGSEDLWIVEFYAPWCGHCKTLAPEWNKVATQLKGEVKVGKVDATVETALGQRFKIGGYPTIKLFPSGKKSDDFTEEFSGSRDATSIANWALEKKAQYKPVMKVEQLTNQKFFDDYCTNIRGVCFIALLPHIYDSSANERNEYIEILQEFAKSNRANPVTFLWSQGGDYYDIEESLGLGSGYPALVAISVNKMKYATLTGSFNSKNIDLFIRALLSGKQPLFNLREAPKVKNVSKWDGADQKQTQTESVDL